jgi:hypothetical protein
MIDDIYTQIQEIQHVPKELNPKQRHSFSKLNLNAQRSQDVLGVSGRSNSYSYRSS